MKALSYRSQIRQHGVWREVLVFGLCVASVFTVTTLVMVGQVRLAVTVVATGLLVSLAMVRVQAAIIAAIIYLVLMGDLRRLLIPVAGWSGTDPLLLVGTAFAALLCAYGWSSKAIRLDTSLARWIFALMVVMLLQIFNPQQGGLQVGVAGTIFLLAPLLWFWVGRTYATPAFIKILLFKVVVPLAVLATLMGYYQKLYGYLPYQMEWYNIAGYTALGTLDTGLAPISFFASATEYGNFLIIASIVLWAAVLHRHQAGLLLIIPFFVSVVLSGSRGPVVKILGMAVVLWAILGETRPVWIARGAFALFVCVIGLIWSLSQVSQLNLDPTFQSKLDRQAKLLEQSEAGSTTDIHGTLMLNGYRRALRDPLGRGLGATSAAALKFGGSHNTTETDTGDVIVATGIVGGVIYHIVIFFIVVSSIRYWIRTRSLLAMAMLGVLGVTFLMWLGGGLYAVSPLVWICIGALDRFQNVNSDIG